MLSIKLVVQAYTKCSPLQHPENRHVKVIANTQFTTAAGPDPHTFMYVDGKFAVTENFVRVDGPRTEVVSQDKVRQSSLQFSGQPDPTAICLGPSMPARCMC